MKIQLSAEKLPVIDRFDQASLHTDLPPADRAALADEISNLENLGYVVDLRSCTIIDKAGGNHDQQG